MAIPEADDIENLIELFNRSDWDEMHLKTSTLEIFLSNDPHAAGPGRAHSTAAVSTGEPLSSTPAAAAVAAPVAAVHALPDGMVGVHAPNLGTFYRAPKPGAAPYVEIGQTVTADTEVCLIEVMKLFTPVRAGSAGIVRDICIADGQMVEFGQLLAVIEPAQ
jgi:acetyl-CoA carboxylase biotin carboxyl carrier protein